MQIASNIVLVFTFATLSYGFYCLYRVGQTMKCMSRTIENATNEINTLREDYEGHQH